MNLPDVTDLAGYRAVYPTIAAAVGSTRAEPAPGELVFLERAISAGLPPGNVGPANLYFLAALTSAVDARQALEIGTASGTSSALLAAIIASNRAAGQAERSGILVETIDYKEYCRFDESKPIGFMVRELVPELSDQVQIHTLRDSAFVREIFPARTLDLAFIDGNHQHPWPLLDVLRVLPLMRSGGWMILHDIDLPAVAVRLGIEARFGAQWVFECWPLAKISAGNIGAVIVPANPGEIRPCLEQLAAKPYEVAKTGWKRYRRMVTGAIEALYPS